MSSALRTRLRATGTAYLDAHRQRSVPALSTLYAPDAKHTNLPAPIAPIFPSVSQPAYLEGLKDLFAMWHSFELDEFAPAVIDEEARKIVLFAKSKGVNDSGTYESEYIVMLKCDDEGKVIEERLQFFDSASLLALVGKMGEKAKELQDNFIRADGK
ncbi:hypothetical protein BDW02DRAFT_631872 [Decorospora gaudefroyi]|uniref:SnoaL-like domain-containing protein n=1 Tax=Decorospora gaudefroyi TaxID=184978 RepID=A0A6A5KGX1_9PLEO|nr:hypothetical protein BDW02DRAFT_631872 [Decorospora gaudefroyi]